MVAFESWTGKTIECSELSGLFCSGLEDKHVKSYADSRGLACELSGGKFESLLKPIGPYLF